MLPLELLCPLKRKDCRPSAKLRKREDRRLTKQDSLRSRPPRRRDAQMLKKEIASTKKNAPKEKQNTNSRWRPVRRMSKPDRLRTSCSSDSSSS